MDTDEELGGAPEAVSQVPIEQPADDGPDDVGPEAGSPNAGGPTRKERKAATWQELKAKASRADALEAQIAADRAERQRLAEQVAELRGRTNAIQESQRPQNTVTDRVKALREEANQHLRVINESKDPATQARALEAYYDAQDKINDVRDDARWQQRRQEIGQSMPDVAVAASRSALENDHPWLATNEAARSAAIGYEQILLAKGKPASITTTREALAMAARDFGIGGQSAPTDASRRKFALPSGGDGEGAGGGTQRTVPMTDGLKKLAEARYPHLEASAAHSKWATDVGQKLAKRG
jgi:hypothetical protein